MIYPCNMVIFNSYVKLPEGMCINGVIIMGFFWDSMRYSCGYLCYGNLWIPEYEWDKE